MTEPTRDDYAFNLRANELREKKAARVAKYLWEQGVTVDDAMMLLPSERAEVLKAASKATPGERAIRTDHPEEFWNGVEGREHLAVFGRLRRAWELWGAYQPEVSSDEPLSLQRRPGPIAPPAGPCPAGAGGEHVLSDAGGLTVGPCALCGAPDEDLMRELESTTCEHGEPPVGCGACHPTDDESDLACDKHGPHPRTVDCAACLFELESPREVADDGSCPWCHEEDTFICGLCGRQNSNPETETHEACGCPKNPARTITDPQKHQDWHRLVVQQGGPAGEVSFVTLRTKKGHTTVTPLTPTVLDDRAEKSGKRVSAARRRAARGD